MTLEGNKFLLNVLLRFLNNYFSSNPSQSAARKDNCVYFKLAYIGPFSIIAQHRIKKLVRTFCSDLDIKLVRVYDRELFISFHVQVVVPDMLVKPTDTSPLAFANISPPTKIPTSLST